MRVPLNLCDSDTVIRINLAARDSLFKLLGRAIPSTRYGVAVVAAVVRTGGR